MATLKTNAPCIHQDEMTIMGKWRVFAAFPLCFCDRIHLLGTSAFTFYHQRLTLRPQIHPACCCVSDQICPLPLSLHVIIWSRTSSGWWSARGTAWLCADVLSFQTLTCNDTRQVHREKQHFASWRLGLQALSTDTTARVCVCVCVIACQRLCWASLAC